MSLISTARALDDARFLWRVRAAMLNTAVTKYTSTNANEKALAEAILDDPMMPNRSMEALVATNNSVSAAVIIDDMNTVDTEAVTDAMIMTAVSNYWTAVANRTAERKAAIASGQAI
jgi:hypothetical protein